MKRLGRFLWVAFIGWWASLGFMLSGIILFMSIVFIPFAIQCFRISRVVLYPFNKGVAIDPSARPIANILWLIFGGIEYATAYACLGVLLCLTLIGIPAGKQCFKIMKLCAFPFGATIG